MLFMHFLM